MSSNSKQGTFVEHLDELRKRLTLVIVVNVIAMFICYQYIDILIQYLLNLNPGMELVYVGPSELFMVYIKVSLLCAIVLCSPITLYQIWAFVAKGLYSNEKVYVLLSLILGLAFFVIGVVFCYFVVLPITLSYFVRISISDITAMISIDQFMSFCNQLLLCFGVIFEMPILTFLLSKIGILKPAFFNEKRGFLYIVIFVIAAIITPPDIISQMLLGIPMCLLLEISMWICKAVDKVNTRKLNAVKAL